MAKIKNSNMAILKSENITEFCNSNKIKFSRVLAGLLITAVIFAQSVITPLANSAQMHFEGISATGAVMTDTESPVEVEREVLTFDITEFPDFDYKSVSDMQAYSSKVTAEYTFFNPSEYEITAKLLFPFGNRPNYYFGRVFDEEKGSYVYYDDTEKFNIMARGEEIEKTLRHTYSKGFGDFELEEQLSRLREDFFEEGFLTRSTAVVKYTFSVNSIEEGYQNGIFSVALEENGERAYLVSNYNSFKRVGDKFRLGYQGKAGEQFVIYSLGGTSPALENLANWQCHEDAKFKKEIEGNITLCAKEELIFADLAFASYNSALGVSEADWYNALVDYLQERKDTDFLFRAPSDNFDISENLMRWYEYSLTFGAGERLVNSVCAPIYPDINAYYEPEIYEFNYLSTPAKTWRKFGSLEIKINTPYALVESMSAPQEAEGYPTPVYVKTDSGYSISYETLPNEDISFTLSKSEKPERIKQYYEDHRFFPLEIRIVLTAVLSVTVLVLSVTLAVIFVKNIRKAKRDKKS